MANLSKIKELAREQGLTIEQVAIEAEMTPQALHKLIRENSTKIETLERLANILKVSPRIFFEDSSSSVAVSGVNVTNGGGSQSVGNINNVKSQDEAVAALVAQLSKKDEQIDRLLGLLEKMK